MREKIHLNAAGFGIVFALLVGGCAEQRWYSSDVRTLPGGGPAAKVAAEPSFSFVVLGDSRDGVKVFKQIISEINLLDPDLVFDTGDLIRGVGKGSAAEKADKTEAMWDEFDRIVEDFEVPLIMVVGNHDVRSPMTRGIYHRRYGRTYFSFDHKGVHFIVLDSETQDEGAERAEDNWHNRIDGEQLDWLKQDLAASKDARATFVLLHKPFWQTGGFAGGPFEYWMETIHPLLVNGGVDAVFGGHDHLYRKNDQIDGVHYYTSGGGGVPLRGRLQDGAFHHYCLVTVRGDEWKVAVVKPGSVEPDTIVNRIPGLDNYVFRFSTISPLGTPIAGKVLPSKMSFKNVSGQTVKITAALVADAQSKWQVTPAKRVLTIKSMQTGTIQFDAMIDDPKDAYPAPRFALTMTGKDRKTFETVVSPALDPIQVVRCPKVTTSPTIDGKLDDPIWKIAGVLSTFWTPKGEHQTRYATEVRLAYDAENLYLAFRCHEPNLDGLVAKSTGRERKDKTNPYHWTFLDDCIEIYVDANYDRKTYYQFVFNPTDGVFDAIDIRASWNGQFTWKTGREADAWTVEIAIPWKTTGLKAATPGTRIGFNAVRSRVQKPAEMSQWSPTFAGNHVPTQFGTLILE